MDDIYLSSSVKLGLSYFFVLLTSVLRSNFLSWRLSSIQTATNFTISWSHYSIGWTGLFCPCVLFGRNVESLRDDTPWTTPCICHAICVEGGMALAAATAIFHGVDPRTSFLICEGLLFAWWMCGIYTGLVRQSLQRKYHLKVTMIFLCIAHFTLAKCYCIYKRILFPHLVNP